MAYNLTNHVNKRKDLREKLDAITKQVGEKAKVMDAENRSFTAEELNDLGGLKTQAEGIAAQIAALDNIAAVEGLNAIQAGIVPKGSPAAQQIEQQQAKASLPRYGKLRAFRGEGASREAFRFGRWCQAAVFGNAKAADWCRENGLDIGAVMSSTDNSKGGIFVPEEFLNTIIDLREQYGVFRQNARVQPMNSDTLTIPRRKSGLTAYFTADATAVSAMSDKSFDGITLTAKEIVAETLINNTLMEDATINVADDIASEMVYSFVNLEDTCGFSGDGSQTYGGIRGLKNKLAAGSVVAAASTHTSVESLTLADYLKARAAVPNFPGLMPAWYCHKAIYDVSMSALAYNAGGNTASDLSGGFARTFLGDPVVFVNVMDKTLGADVSVIKTYYGDLRMAATLGDRRQIAVASDTSLYFRTRQTLIQGTSRMDINVHEIGDATNAGPIVALKTAAS